MTCAKQKCSTDGMVKHQLWMGGGVAENKQVMSEWLHLNVVKN